MQRHFKAGPDAISEVYRGEGAVFCDECGTAWPCDAFRLAAALAETRRWTVVAVDAVKTEADNEVATLQAQLAEARGKLDTERAENVAQHKALVAIAKLHGIDSPLQLIVTAENNDDTYADLLVRKVGSAVAALTQDAARRRADGEQLRAALEWLDESVREGRGAFEFGENEDGYVGLWRNDSDRPWGVGDTAIEALLDAHQKALSATSVIHSTADALIASQRTSGEGK